MLALLDSFLLFHSDQILYLKLFTQAWWTSFIESSDYVHMRNFSAIEIRCYLLVSIWFSRFTRSIVASRSFLFRLQIDWINMKAAKNQTNQIREAKKTLFLFVFEGDFYFDIENAASMFMCGVRCVISLSARYAI